MGENGKTSCSFPGYNITTDKTATQKTAGGGSLGIFSK
jgi:hypothetical protein